MTGYYHSAFIVPRVSFWQVIPLRLAFDRRYSNLAFKAVGCKNMQDIDLMRMHAPLLVFFLIPFPGNEIEFHLMKISFCVFTQEEVFLGFVEAFFQQEVQPK